jgi:hypothetical protein
VSLSLPRDPCARDRVVHVLPVYLGRFITRDGLQLLVLLGSWSSEMAAGATMMLLQLTSMHARTVGDPIASLHACALTEACEYLLQQQR